MNVTTKKATRSWHIAIKVPLQTVLGGFYKANKSKSFPKSQGQLAKLIIPDLLSSSMKNEAFINCNLWASVPISRAKVAVGLVSPCL